MPTPKQVRYHYRRICKLREKLSDALTEAHHAGVLVYEHDRYREDSPCPLLYEAQERIDDTTEKQLAQAMREEILRGG